MSRNLFHVSEEALEEEPEGGGLKKSLVLFNCKACHRGFGIIGLFPQDVIKSVLAGGCIFCKDKKAGFQYAIETCDLNSTYSEEHMRQESYLDSIIKSVSW